MIDNEDLGPGKAFLFLSILGWVIAFAGAWVDFPYTHLVIWAILLFATVRHKLVVKELILLYVLIGPIISNRFAFKLGPLPDMTFDRLLVIMAFIVERRERKATGEKWIVNVFDRRILMLILVGALSIVFSFMIKTPLRILIDSLIIPFIMFLFAKRFSRDESFLKTFYHICIINVLICGALGMAERFTHRDLLIVGTGDPKFDDGRINGPSADAEEFGMTMTTMILVVTNVGAAVADTRAWVRLRWASIGLGVLAVFNTLTRGIWIALAIGLLAQLSLNLRRRIGVFVAIIVLLPFAMPVTALMFGGNGGLNGRLENTETIYARIATFSTALRMFIDKPVLGVGYGAFTEAYERDPDRYETYFRNVVSVPMPHNAYLATLSEMGILGLGFWVVVLGTAFFSAGQVKRYDPNMLHVVFANALICVLVAYLVDGFGHDFTRNLSFINKLFYLLMGITGGFVQVLQQKAKQAEADLQVRNQAHQALPEM